MRTPGSTFLSALTTTLTLKFSREITVQLTGREPGLCYWFFLALVFFPFDFSAYLPLRLRFSLELLWLRAASTCDKAVIETASIDSG